MKEKEYKPQPEESKVEEPAAAYGIDTLSLEELRQATINELMELKEKYSFRELRERISQLKREEVGGKEDLPYPWCPTDEQLRKELAEAEREIDNGVPGCTLEEFIEEMKKW